MTEKRFVLTSEKIGKHWEILITDYQTDEPFDDTTYDATDNYQDTLDNMEDLCLLLNQIHEENEQLKSEYKVLHTQHQDLRKFVENNFDEYLTRKKLNRQIIKLSDENEQLKQENYELEKFRYILFDQMNKINQRINQRRGEN